MPTIGFVTSKKENEKRRAILPDALQGLRNPGSVVIEHGYGEDLNISDQAYLDKGARIASREECLKQDVVCDPKIGDAEFLGDLTENQTIFGWVHAERDPERTTLLLERGLTAVAWEDMYQNGRHVFWRNNELAGEAAVLHALTLFGKLPYNCKVAIIGRGNTGRGAFRILTSLGAEVTVYNRRTEKLLRKEIGQYDIIVNSVFWDMTRKDYLISRADLARMKKPSMIVDVSCDMDGAIESSHPSTFEEPVFMDSGVLHYAVDHTPSIFSYSVSSILSDIVARYLDPITEGAIHDHPVLGKAIIIEKGRILDKKTIIFQKHDRLI
ncbi:MAG: N(5)-(carboxyethyl)ornithine synthase [Ruminococcaceae bacterium]|nr:N(5)-(carboxyethyl)ornithine synthase [Oscillospiraceae bacterium]